MGFKTFGFGGGRADVWQPQDRELNIYWGAEKANGLATNAIQATANSKIHWPRSRWG